MTGRSRVVLDTDTLRFSLTHPSFRDRVIDEFPLWALSAVVAHELRRAARPKARPAVDAVLRRIPRRITPEWSDWMRASDYLANLGSRRGFDPVSLPRHQNDCLIAASAWRAGMPVVTCNGADFRRIVDFFGTRAGPVVVLPNPA